MKYLLFVTIFVAQYTYAQMHDDFSDGDFLLNPSWHGHLQKFKVNDNFQLQSTSEITNDRFYLSTEQQLAIANWSFYVKLNFSTSSSNYTDIFLIASDSNLLSPTLTGYFVRLGNTQDEVSLYRKDLNGIVRIIDGLDGTIAGNNNEVWVNVSRGNDFRFLLSYKVGAESNRFYEEPGYDSVYRQSQYMGVLIQQSTSSFFQKHYFDDFNVTSFVPDTLPPFVESVLSSSDSVVMIRFSEPLMDNSVLNPFSFEVNQGVGFPQNIQRDVFDPLLFRLTFFHPFPERELLRLSVTGISDLMGNIMRDTSINFAFITPRYGDVLITEIMADPTPVVQLPEVEWVELFNNTSAYINLSGWKFCKNKVLCNTLPSYLLAPAAGVVLTSQNGVNEFVNTSSIIGITGFPSLNNGGDLLSLSAPDGTMVHAVQYSDTWYKDDFKKNGGFSLEMVDITKFCLQEENWKASVSSSGGTPGEENSVNGSTNDYPNLRPLRVTVADSLHIVVWFNQPVDSLSALSGSYLISGNAGRIVNVTPIGPLYKSVRLRLERPLEQGVIYEVMINGIQNCGGSMVASLYSLRVGLPVIPRESDVIINEILFNPFPNEVDFVELYHNGSAPVDMYDLFLGNRNVSGVASSIARITEEHFLLFPGDFVVITENPLQVQQRYPTRAPQQFISMYTPSWPDDRGNVVLLNNAGELIDELAYHKSWHYPLLSDAEGVSLERIKYDNPTRDKNNWHSAASSSNYGTPGYRNSQSVTAEFQDAEIIVSPKIISPDNDGRDDFAIISYTFPDNGYVATVTVFDRLGRAVRLLCRNQLCGTMGFWKWDGLEESGRPLPEGIYILYGEILHPSGKSAKFKRVIVLARN